MINGVTEVNQFFSLRTNSHMLGLTEIFTILAFPIYKQGHATYLQHQPTCLQNYVQAVIAVTGNYNSRHRFPWHRLNSLCFCSWTKWWTEGTHVLCRIFSVWKCYARHTDSWQQVSFPFCCTSKGPRTILNPAPYHRILTRKHKRIDNCICRALTKPMF